MINCPFCWTKSCTIPVPLQSRSFAMVWCFQNTGQMSLVSSTLGIPLVFLIPSYPYILLNIKVVTSVPPDKVNLLQAVNSYEISVFFHTFGLSISPRLLRVIDKLIAVVPWSFNPVQRARLGFDDLGCKSKRNTDWNSWTHTMFLVRD